MSRNDYTYNNLSIQRMNKLLLNYYNTFMIQTKDSAGNEYIFKEMKDISSGKTATIPTTFDANSVAYNIEMFNDFIRSIINFKLSNNLSYYDKALKIKNADNTTNVGVVRHIFSCINIVNVFVDILEAYKYFLDNETDPISFLKEITEIRLVSQYAKKSISSFGTNRKQNVGYKRGLSTSDTNTLFLSIRSLVITSSGSSNHIFDLNTSTTTQTLAENTGLFNSVGALVKTGPDVSAPDVTYRYQSVSKEGTNIKINDAIYSYKNYTDLFNFENRDKYILQNFLYCLMKLEPDNIRMQINGLYYYYKTIKAYIVLVLTSWNVTINTLTGSSATLDKILLLSTATGETDDFLPSDHTNFHSIKTKDYITNTSINATNIVTDYKNCLNIVGFNLLKYKQDLLDYKSSNIKIFDTNYRLVESTIIYNASNYNNTQVSLETTGDNENLRNIILDSNLKQNLINNYVIEYNGKLFNIQDIKNNAGTATKQQIIIKAQINNDNDIIPNFVITSSASSGVYNNVSAKIVKKGIYALKNDFITGKNELGEINKNIIKNTSLINNQRTVYDYYSNKDKLISNQLYVYTVIVGIMFFSIVGMNIVKVDKNLRKLVSMIYAGIIIVLLIIYYIISSTYIENFSNVNGYNQIRENFAVIQNVDALKTEGYTPEQKKLFLSGQIERINLIIIDLLQYAMSTIPLSETNDFYNEMNQILINETNDKSAINDTLSFKKSLGYSNIDILKYEMNNKKVYINVILFSALIYIVLYFAYIHFSEEYSNLIFFIGLIFFIILFSYYLIFISKYVRNRSKNIYWGPVDESKI